MNSRNIAALVRATVNKLTAGERNQIRNLVLLLIVASIFELISIAALGPLINLVIAGVSLPPVLETIACGISDSCIDRNFLLKFVSSIFIVATIIAGYVRITLLRRNLRFSFDLGHRLSSAIVMNVLREDYESSSNRNTGEIAATISSKITMFVFQTIYPLVTLFSASFIVLIVVSGLLFLNPKSTLLVAGLLGSIYAVVTTLNKKKLMANSIVISSSLDESQRIIQDILKSKREIALENLDSLFYDRFVDVDRRLKLAQRGSRFINESPRLAIEAAILSLFGSYVLVAAYLRFDASDLVPTIAVGALAGLRMLPLVNQIYSANGDLKSGSESAQSVLTYLEERGSSSAANSMQIEFKRDIVLQDLQFYYPLSDKPVLDISSLSIPKNKVVGVFGRSGSGKSTLLDVLAGLLTPRCGKILIDGREVVLKNNVFWLQSISYVSQNNFFLDASVAENIAFTRNIETIDRDRLAQSLQLSGINEFLSRLEGGVNFLVGENGERLSGGQRQRVAIARAIYKESDIIIFDESTSALDFATELFFLGQLAELKKTRTIILVTHRKKASEFCDVTYELFGGKVGAHLLDAS